MAKAQTGGRALSDREIIALFLARDEQALAACEEKYGALIGTICRGVLFDVRDAEECKSDVLFRHWERIPAVLPDSLPAFISKVARQTAVNRYRENTQKRRVPAAMTSPIEELIH